jgi:oxygen-independent coproporphyrinogen-3 oxidase
MNAPFTPTPSLIDVARRMVPRYTSYPTAPHFSPAVTAETYGGWLEKVRDRGEAISLYLHVPFCRTICNYCGCTTKAALRDDPVRAYAAAIHDEIALLAERLGPVEVSHIHWGGGTPSILPPDCFDALVRDLSNRFRFRPDMEHAIELDPRHVTAEGARRLAGLGINRTSLGVQTLDVAVQKAIARIQPLGVVEASFAYMREAGITAINADLMYGLPLQTLDTIHDTAERVLGLQPSRFAIFGYAHLPWMKRHQRLIDEAALPDAAERIRQAGLAREILERGGYVEIGIDHFALPHDALTRAQEERRLHRNFQGYTDDAATTLIGIGASSISRTPWGFAQNAPDNHSWRRAIESGQLPTVRGKAYEGDDLLRAAVIEDLLCTFGVDLAEVAIRHGASVDSFGEDLRRLAPLVNAGWVELRGSRVAVRRHRHEIARVVAAEFDAYLGRGGRHSTAV